MATRAINLLDKANKIKKGKERMCWMVGDTILPEETDLGAAPSRVDAFRAARDAGTNPKDHLPAVGSAQVKLSGDAPTMPIGPQGAEPRQPATFDV